ncbi:MAG: hypothetical protein WD847_08310 [Pirellulales bacterium]
MTTKDDMADLQRRLQRAEAQLAATLRRNEVLESMVRWYHDLDIEDLYGIDADQLESAREAGYLPNSIPCHVHLGAEIAYWIKRDCPRD